MPAPGLLLHQLDDPRLVVVGIKGRYEVGDDGHRDQYTRNNDIWSQEKSQQAAEKAGLRLFVANHARWCHTAAPVNPRDEIFWWTPNSH